MSDFLDSVCYFFIALNALIFVYAYIKCANRLLLYFMCYTVSMALNQLVMEIIYSYGLDNIILSHVYFILQFVFLSLWYRELIKDKRFRRLNTYLLYSIPLLIIILFSLNPKALLNFDIPEILLCSLPLIGYAVYYLFISLEQKSTIWVLVSMGIFVYLSSSLLLFVGGSLVIEEYLGRGYINILWIVNNFIYLCYQVLITVEWYKNYGKKLIAGGL